jgi:2-furoate---CoA ligase
MPSRHWASQLAGIVVTPLNWHIKREELDYCLNDAEPPRSFSTMSRRTRSPARPRPSGCHGSQSARSTAPPAVSKTSKAAQKGFAPRAEPDDLSLLLYTSRTTGRPKGAPRRHRAERAAALAHVAQNLYARGERTLGVMPLYHTMGVHSCWPWDL